MLEAHEKAVAQSPARLATMGGGLIFVGVLSSLFTGHTGDMISWAAILVGVSIMAYAGIVKPQLPEPVDGVPLSEMEQQSFFGYLTFRWMVPIHEKANELGKMDKEDMAMLHSQDDPVKLYRGYLSFGYGRRGPWWFMLRVMFGSPTQRFLLGYRLTCEFIVRGKNLVRPILLQQLLLATAEDLPPDAPVPLIPRGFKWFLAMIVVEIIEGIAFMQNFFTESRHDMNAHAIVSMAVYRCAFSGSPGWGMGVTKAPDVGKLTNMMSTDASKILSLIHI